jgi:hypothetical protein
MIAGVQKAGKGGAMTIPQRIGNDLGGRKVIADIA